MRECGNQTREQKINYIMERLTPQNIGFILDSLALIKEQPFQLFMVGMGYAVREIKQKIKELGLSHKVTLLGQIHDRERLKHIYAAADLFVFPSLIALSILYK